MFDSAFRSRLEQPLDRLAAALERAGLTPDFVTLVGLLIGVGACFAVAFGRWWIGLVLWILNRLADGLDGPLARRRGPTEFGGYFDILADFAIYGGVLVAMGIDRPETRVASLVVFLAYYLSGSSFLAFSTLATRRELDGDGRTLIFPAGLAEGSETIAAYIVILAFPGQAETLLWIWAAIVGFTFLQRLTLITKMLRP